MLVVADTDQGVAVFCGDLVYSVRHQLLGPTNTFRDLGTSANHVVARRQEKAALKRMMQVAPRFRLFPSHDWPVWVQDGQVVEGAQDCLSGRAAGCWCQQTSLGYPDTDLSTATSRSQA
jgi:glyoxylase-like metal-dependent hydrolase (beta-lactamase superfamily II)